jgi:hypothetical protein
MSHIERHRHSTRSQRDCLEMKLNVGCNKHEARFDLTATKFPVPDLAAQRICRLKQDQIRRDQPRSAKNALGDRSVILRRNPFYRDGRVDDDQ